MARRNRQAWSKVSAEMSELRPGLAAVRELARSAQGVREAGELLDRICASVAETYGVRGVLVLPLLSQDRCIGFLTADHGGEPFELDSSAAELLRTIGVLVASFLESALAQEELRRLDELKTNFIALASHELRTPAAVIYGISSTLQLRGGELKDEQVSDLRGVLYDHSNRLRQLVDQLLDLSRLEAKAIRIRPEPIQVRRHVEELVASLVPEHAAGIELIIPPELEAVSDLAAFDR